MDAAANFYPHGALYTNNDFGILAVIKSIHLDEFIEIVNILLDILVFPPK